MVLLACATIVWIVSFVSPLLALAADATAENGITNSTLMIARHGIAPKQDAAPTDRCPEGRSQPWDLWPFLRGGPGRGGRHGKRHSWGSGAGRRRRSMSSKPAARTGVARGPETRRRSKPTSGAKGPSAASRAPRRSRAFRQ